eukprot:705734-Rhodomonas_salina.2
MSAAAPRAGVGENRGAAVPRVGANRSGCVFDRALAHGLNELWKRHSLVSASRRLGQMRSRNSKQRMQCIASMRTEPHVAQAIERVCQYYASHCGGRKGYAGTGHCIAGA